MASVRAKLAKGTAWITASRLITNVLTVGSTLLLARLLMPADFGLVALATTMLAILNAITGVSLGSALVQHPNVTDEHFHTAWSVQFVRATLLALVFAAAAWPASLIFAEPRLVGVMLALAVSVLLGGLSNPRSIMLQKQLVFWQQFVMEVAQKVLSLIVSVSVALAFRSYWAIVAGQMSWTISGVVISYFILPFRPRLGWAHWRELFGFSMWLTFSQVVNTINWRFDQLMIGGLLSKTALGYYTVGDNLASMPTREALAPLTSTLFPAFTAVAHDRARLTQAYQSAQALVTTVALPVGVGMALIAEPLVRLTMSAKWLPAVLVIQVLGSVFALQTLGSLSHPLAMAVGQTRLIFKRDLQSFALRLPFVVGGLIIAGLPGIIFARALAGSLNIGFNMIVVKQITGLDFRRQLAPNARSLVAVAAMAALVALTDRSVQISASTTGLIGRLGLLIAIGGVVYVGVQSLLWLVSGRPRGPEMEFVALLRRLRQYVRRDPPPAGQPAAR